MPARGGVSTRCQHWRCAAAMPGLNGILARWCRKGSSACTRNLRAHSGHAPDSRQGRPARAGQSPFRSPDFWVRLALLLAVTFFFANVVSASFAAHVNRHRLHVCLQEVSSDDVLAVTSTSQSITGGTQGAGERRPGQTAPPASPPGGLRSPPTSWSRCWRSVAAAALDAASRRPSAGGGRQAAGGSG
jgi:hypothetical protein